MAGASDIIGVDVKESKFELAKSFGADFCLNPAQCKDDGRADLLARHKDSSLSLKKGSRREVEEKWKGSGREMGGKLTSLHSTQAALVD